MPARLIRYQKDLPQLTKKERWRQRIQHAPSPGAKALQMEELAYWSLPCWLVTAVIVPSVPSVSVAPPAVKYSAVALPARPSLPGEIDHSPGSTICAPVLSRRKSWKRPVTGSKAAIIPLPKLPTRMLWVYGPKSLGAIAIPHGASRKLPCSNCSSFFPLGE